MRRTSTLRASAAAFGLMAGFAITPDVPSPLERSVTPYAVAVAWRVSNPEPPVAGVEADDWGGRMAPPPARPAPGRPSAPRVRRAPTRVHAPGHAHPAPRAKPAPKAEAVHRPVPRGAEMAAATFGVGKRECPRAAAETPRIVGTRQS
jgi:hypothetical protein